MSHDVSEYIAALLASERLGHQVAYHRVLPESRARFAENRRAWPRAINDVLAAGGIESLYAHQAYATDVIRSGRNVVVATPTASGKTFIYNLPVIERVLGDPDCRALYLFPLKALAQDQLGTFESLTAHWLEEARPTAAIYDGDTSQWFRRKIRDNPPHVLMTNPEMLHLSLLPYHEKWAQFLAGLSFVVVDEVHTYRGVLGSHMAQVFRRLSRVCRRFGADPAYVFCSATVGNPGELAHSLTGVDAECVTESGSPQGKRHFVFLNPLEGAAQTAIMLLQSALHRGLRTIVYTQSRKMTELISMWASQRAGEYKDRISAYRAGFLPEERREIEARMTSGDLLAVISTSALELGIDIGDLDLCILVGYPGTVMQTLQRGGRVGRGMQESAVVLVAGEDALDQYFMRNPEDFFEREPERAVLNPHNPVILERHLECAAAELPFSADEEWINAPGTAEVVAGMEQRGRLLRSREGDMLYSVRKRPHFEVDLRGAGGRYTIEAVGPQPVGGGAKGDSGTKSDSGTIIGEVDEHRAFKETHPGAVYLHRGQSHVIDDLDINTRTVRARRRKVNYYTRTRGNKTTEILEIFDSRTAWGTNVHLGRLKVTETVTGYEKRRVFGNKMMTIVPLDLPPIVFETEGIWFEVPLGSLRACEKEFYHFMGSIHALEHAAIGILPLLVMTDRNDLGGISTPMHPQVGLPSVFIYDGMPGGVGLSRQAFEMAEDLFSRTDAAIRSCECEIGCPSCVHSPKCGSGNRPIDKQGALFLLDHIRRGAEPEPNRGMIDLVQQAQREREKDMQGNDNMHPVAQGGPASGAAPGNLRYGVLDIETQLSAQEVGGWHKAHKMRVSCAVLYDSATDEYLTYLEDDMAALFSRLQDFDLIVGFNIRRFDYKVLSAYTRENLQDLPTLDMLLHIYERLGYRLSLDHLAQATLGAKKSADGLQALEWWKQGRIDDIVAYCKQDVAVTRDLFLHGREHRHLLFTNKAGNTVRLPVDW